MLLTCALSSCDNATEQFEERPAYVSFWGSEAEVHFLDEPVVAGSAEEVLVVTYGGACDEVAPSAVVVTGNTAVIDTKVRVGRSEVCPAPLVPKTHRVEVTFSNPGPAEVVVRGWKSGRDVIDEPAEKRFAIVVEPAQ